MEQYNYWHIEFISCEGNERWTVVKTPMEWSEWEVRSNFRTGGCGDDPAEVGEIYETSDTDYTYDLT